MTIKLLIGIPLHSHHETTIKNVKYFINNKNLLYKLGIDVQILISCDWDHSDISHQLKKLNYKNCDKLKLDYVIRDATSMVDNWNSALKLFDIHDYCYLLHDDDLINEEPFFQNILPALVHYQPSILNFNALLDKCKDKKILQRKIDSLKITDNKEYFNFPCKGLFPAPSQTIFATQKISKLLIYTSDLYWCPEVKLYIDIMSHNNAKMITHPGIGVIRKIHTGQVSYNTLWKGSADLMVLGGKDKYFLFIKKYLHNLGQYENIIDYFDHIFLTEDFYQKDNFNKILSFASRYEIVRYCFLTCLSNYIRKAIQTVSVQDVMILKIYSICCETKSIFLKEKIIRTVEQAINYNKEKFINRRTFDYEFLKNLDAKFKNEMYSKDYIQKRIQATIAFNI